MDGRTRQPHAGTMECVRDLFWALHPSGDWKVAESPAAPPTGYAADLLKLLPKGREQSMAALQPLVDALRATGGRRGPGARVADLLRRMWDEGQKGQTVYATARQLKKERKAAEKMLAEKAKQQREKEAELGDRGAKKAPEGKPAQEPEKGSGLQGG